MAVGVKSTREDRRAVEGISLADVSESVSFPCFPAPGAFVTFLRDFPRLVSHIPARSRPQCRSWKQFSYMFAPSRFVLLQSRCRVWVCRGASLAFDFLLSSLPQVFHEMDLDGSGEVTFGELLKLMYPYATPSELETMESWVRQKQIVSSVEAFAAFVSSRERGVHISGGQRARARARARARVDGGADEGVETDV